MFHSTRFPDPEVRFRSKEKFFPLSVLCAAWLWNLGFFLIPTTCHLWLFSVVRKMTRCWLFGCLSLRPNHCRSLPLSADAYIVNSDGILSRLCLLMFTGRVEEKQRFLCLHFLGYYYRRLTACVLPPSPTTQRMYESVVFPRHNIYIYIYIYIYTESLALWIEWSPMVWKTRVQSQVESNQRIKNWYLLSTQHYKVRINSKVEQSLVFDVAAIEKGAFRSS